MLMAKCSAILLTSSRFIAGFKVFFNDVFQGAIFQTEVGGHLLQPAVLIFQVFKFFYISGFHATVLRFPVVIAGFGNAGLTTDVLHGTSGFNRLQDGDDLVLSKPGLRMAISSGQRYQYAGRSLKVNGAFNWDTYNTPWHATHYSPCFHS